MEVRPGYKRTEVGLIPEVWGVMPVTGATQAIFLGLTSKVDYVTIGGVPLVRASDISSGRLSFDSVRTISQRQHRELTKYRRAKRGDVLVSKSGSLGVCAIVDVEREFSIYESIIVLQPNNRLDSLFLLSLLRDENTQNRMIGDRVGSTVGHLNLEVFRTLVIPVPPLSEQRAIAAALSDVDALLGGLEWLIAKKRDLKQAATQQLLTGQTRLPGFSGEWEVKRLGEVVTIIKGQLITEGNANPGPIPVIAGGKRPAYFHNRANRTGKTVTISASGASAGYVAFFAEPIFASDCSTISESEEYSIEFVYFQLQLKQSAIYKAQTGGAQPHIHAADVNPIEVFWPSVREQTAIAAILSDMDAEIAALEARRDKTRALKQGMMQELLTGKTRLI